MKNQLHEKGFKGVRDREQVIRKYDELVTTLHLPRVKDEVLARMSNNELYRLCEDTYNRLPGKKKIYYAQALGKLRENDTSFHWWWKDMVRIFHPNAIGFVVLAFKSIVLYPAYVKRKKAEIAKRKVEAEEAKKTMVDAAKSSIPFVKPEASKA
jgi:hypothetical protein